MNKVFTCIFTLTLTGLLVARTVMGADAQISEKPSIPNLKAHDISMTVHAQYSLFLPKDYGEDTTKRWPVLLFLHGIGESGTNLWLTAKHGPIKFIMSHPDFPFIFVSPQCPADQTWSDENVLRILDEIQTQYATDTNRVYLTGLSMGGFGTWSLATAYPERFSAVAPVSGGGAGIDLILGSCRGKGDALKQLPFWVFHGAKDTVVPIEESKRMIKALKIIGCTNVKFTVYPKGAHDIWTQTYNNPDLYEWFLKHTRKSEDIK